MLMPGLVAGLMLYPRYRASGAIQIQKSATDGLRLDNLTGSSQDSQGAADALETTLNLQTQVQILQSETLALRVIEDLQLDRTADFKSSFNPIGWALGMLNPAGKPDGKGVALEDAPRRRDHAVAAFAKRLAVKPEAGTRLIRISYTSGDPKIAAAVVNDVSKSLVDFTLQSRSLATAQVSGWLSGQLGDIKKEAEERQGKVESLQRDSGIYSLGISDPQGKEMAYSSSLDRLQQVTQQLSAAISNRILKQALYRSVQNGDPELISSLAGSTLASSSPGVNNAFALLQNLRSQQTALTTQLASDSSKYGSENPKLVDERASLDSINSQIHSEAQRIGTRVENDYKAAQAVEDSTKADYEEQRRAANAVNDKAMGLLIARQEASDSRNLYQTLFARLKEAGVFEGLRSSNVSLVDIGRVPSKPRPDILMCLGVSFIAGLLAGVVLAIFLEATNDRIEAIGAIENALHAPILAVLPTTRKQKLLANGNGLLRKNRRLSDGNGEAVAVAVLDDPNTAYVEALRGLRTSLVYPRSGAAPKSILITSAGEREGKSTLSLNLAAALVLNGSRVLLIDADLRSAALTRYLGFSRDGAEHNGLSGALSESEEPLIRNCVPKLPNLFVLTAGQHTAYPTELLGSERMRSFAAIWKSTFDYVLFDSPPVLAVADALVLSRLVDTALLVTRHGFSTQKGLERAYQIMHDAQTAKIQVIVNDVQRDSESFSDFYGYSGKHYYEEA